MITVQWDFINNIHFTEMAKIDTTFHLQGRVMQRCAALGAPPTIMVREVKITPFNNFIWIHGVSLD